MLLELIARIGLPIDVQLAHSADKTVVFHILFLVLTLVSKLRKLVDDNSRDYLDQKDEENVVLEVIEDESEAVLLEEPEDRLVVLDAV